MLAALGSGLAWMPQAAPAAEPDEARLIAGATTFYCEAAEGGGVTGLACELVLELARRAGHSGAVDLYPFARALAVTAAASHTLLVPVGRTPARESRYRWIVPLLEDDFLVVTKRASTLDISSFEALRDVSVGMVRDGVGAQLSAAHGLRHVNIVTDDLTNAKKLEAGRIDAWFSSWNGICAAQRAAGLSVDGLRRGVVGSHVQVYLVGSLDTAPAVVARWRAAFETMRADGSYAAILRKYQVDPPKP